MNNELLISTVLAVVDSHVNKTLKKIEVIEGPRGPRGLKGKDGSDFHIEDHIDSIKSYILDNIPKSIALTEEQIELLKGEKGDKGRDGKDFSFEAHTEEIEALLSNILESLKSDLKLKFSDLTEEDKLQLKGSRGQRGKPGRDFTYEDFTPEQLDDLKLKFSDLCDYEIEMLTFKYENFTPEQIESLRGKDGKNFTFEDLTESQLSLLKLKFSDLSEKEIQQLKLTFDDLTENDIDMLRGPRGERGRPGKDFTYSDFTQEQIDSFKLRFSDLTKEEVESLKLKFDSLTSEEIEMLRGPRGERGRAGKDFNLEDNVEFIQQTLTSMMPDKEELKLRFEDLSDEDKEQLRGPRGQRGKAGKDFNFDDYKEYFDSLKPHFSEFSEEEKESLKLKFKDLSEEDKKELKLTFEDLTEEERHSLKGPRGQRGRQGVQGEQGIKGEKGDQGLRGPQGIPGPIGYGQKGDRGERGLDGFNGVNAPYVTDVKIEEYGKEIRFVFEFSDNSEIKTNYIELPRGTTTQQYFMPGSSTGSIEQLLVYDEGNPLGFAKSLDVVGDDIELDLTSDGKATLKTLVTNPSIIREVDCDPSVFLGAAVRMDTGDIAVNAIATSYEESNVIGLVTKKSSSTKCDIVFAGKTDEVLSGLDISEEYYLSDTVAGTVVKTADAPTTSGHVRLKLGQPFNSAIFVVSKGERVVRT